MTGVRAQAALVVVALVFLGAALALAYVTASEFQSINEGYGAPSLPEDQYAALFARSQIADQLRRLILPCAVVGLSAPLAVLAVRARMWERRRSARPGGATRG